MDNEKFKSLLETADFFDQTARKLLVTERGLHAETLIASVSRMSGSLMYRSFGHPASLEPGKAVLSDKADFYGPKLMNLMFGTLQQCGHQIGEANVNTEYSSTKYIPINFKESHARLAPFYLKYCEAAKLSHHDAAFAAAIATALLIHDCQEVLDIRKGAGVAIYGLVEGTKTVPYPIGEKSERQPPNPEKKPWYKLW